MKLTVQQLGKRKFGTAHDLEGGVFQVLESNEHERKNEDTKYHLNSCFGKLGLLTTIMIRVQIWTPIYCLTPLMTFRYRLALQKISIMLNYCDQITIFRSYTLLKTLLNSCRSN